MNDSSSFCTGSAPCSAKMTFRLSISPLSVAMMSSNPTSSLSSRSASTISNTFSTTIRAEAPANPGWSSINGPGPGAGDRGVAAIITYVVSVLCNNLLFFSIRNQLFLNRNHALWFKNHVFCFQTIWFVINKIMIAIHKSSFLYHKPWHLEPTLMSNHAL